MAKIKLIDLYGCVQSALVVSGATKNSIDDYRCSGFHPLQRFFEQKGCEYYSQKLAEEFARDTLNAYKNNHITKRKYQRIRKIVAMLDEYQRTGALTWAYLPRYNATSLTCKHFETVWTQYLLDLSRNEKYPPSKIAEIKSVIKQFLRYLEEQGYRKLRCLTRKIVSAFIPVVAERYSRSISNVIWALKSFLRYLHENKYIDSDLVSVLPRYPAKHRKHFVGFTRNEAQTLIRSVPSETGFGKRNIAMFTLAESTGLRAVDVANMKMCDIDWQNKTISIIQHKTKRHLTLPLENHVGDALAEYILHGRPASDSRFIFLTSRRPFRPLRAAAISLIASRCIEKSGIENNSSFRKGFHCFRRSVGTYLLEAKFPLTMISEILGHCHIDTAKPYLSTDLEGLRTCAIGLEGIEIRTGVFR